jgi:hypothetical protein
MTASTLPYALYGLLIVGVFLAWFYLCWQDYAIERGRQELFELRNTWFDLVTANPQWRDHPASRVVRTLFDAQIRWLHKLSLPLVVLALFMPRVQRREASKLVESAIRNLPDVELRRQAGRLQEEAMLKIGCTMMQRSLTVWIVALLLLPMALPVVLVIAFALKLPAKAQSIPVARADQAAGLRATTLRTLRHFSEAELSIAVHEDTELPRSITADHFAS